MIIIRPTSGRASLLAACLLALGLAACGSEDKAVTTTTVETDGVTASVEISQPWCRPSPTGAEVGACYLTIRSSGDNRVTGVATPLAADAQIHDMVMDDGVMTMTELTDGLPLAADQTVALAPGGKHLMLLGLTAPLVEGTAIPLTLTFSDTPAMTVQASVRQPQQP